MQTPLVSVIIPCYNHGKYINEAVQSVLNQPYENFEIVIVNDGSKDDSKEIISKIIHQKVRAIHINNNGLANARNIAIENSKGKYLLPLDADDKIAAGYITKAVNIFETKKDVGIVYGKAHLFGERNEEWILEKYELKSMLIANKIYASAMFKKEDYDLTGGYDKTFCYGWEDWDFWLSIISLKREVYFIDELVFYYRIINNSMIRKMTTSEKQITKQQIYLKHFHLYETLFKDPLSLYHDYEYYKNGFNKLMSNNLIRSINFIAKKIKRKNAV